MNAVLVCGMAKVIKLGAGDRMEVRNNGGVLKAAGQRFADGGASSHAAML